MPYLRIFIADKLLEQHELTSRVTTIGRANDNDIVLRDSHVSKYHATIRKQDDSYILTDNDSANGVFVGGRRLRQKTLRYWDEIQIYKYVLTFMATARLRTEESGMPGEHTGPPQQEATMEVDISCLGDLARLKKNINVPVLSLPGPDGHTLRHVLEKVNCRIGKDGQCDLALRGLLVPALAAQIQRRSDGCYVIPTWRGRVSLNGRRIREPVKLADGDRFRVCGTTISFYLRPLDKG